VQAPRAFDRNKSVRCFSALVIKLAGASIVKLSRIPA
jgi:hypothetical protein